MSNPFELFGLPLQFKLDLQALEERYSQAQTLTHPDRFIGKSPLEQRLAAEQSIRFTEGYHTLKNPLQRARAFLLAKGLEIPGEGGTTIPASSLLIEVMEWRDKIEQAQQKSDLIPLQEDLQQQYTQAEEQLDTLAESDLIKAYLRLVYTHKALEEISLQLRRLKA